MSVLERLGRRRRWTLAIAAGALWPADALACAVCVGLTKNDMAFLWSALFLMALPVAMAGGIGGWLYYAYRRAAARRRVPHLVVSEKES